MEAEVPLPDLRTVGRAIRQTTEHLALECARPSGRAPAWSELHWCVAQAVSVIHGVSPLLSRRLRWQGPRAWREFLEQQWRHTLHRQRRIDALMVRIDAAAREARLGLLALKGAALHDLGIYACGERPMADVDLLIREFDFGASVALLEQLGYSLSHRTRRECIFEPQGPKTSTAHFGEHADNAIKIELHTRIAERLPVREASITGLLLPDSAAPGLQRYRCAGTLMTHLLLHAAGNMRARALRLIQLNDIAALSSRLSAEEWDRLLGGEHEQAWWAFPPLEMSARYYPDAIPAAVLARARAACPPLLRALCERQRLSDVSLSYLWVQFCPGIEWCHSVSEALQFIQDRLFPSPAMRAEIRQCEATQLWALNTPWSRASRPRRMARWLLSRSPRDATMAPVRAAWARSGLRR